MLGAVVLHEISTLVQSGFYNKDRIMVIFLEEMYAPGELDEAQVASAIDDAMEKWNHEKQQWPAVTDCDRLDKAFEAINRRGIIGLQNAGHTQSDGYDDFRMTLDKHPKKAEVIGYCFYHGQDLSRAVDGGGLYLAFGPTDPAAEEKQGPMVGNIVREELERTGLKVNWDGTFANRMLIPGIVWQKR